MEILVSAIVTFLIALIIPQFLGLTSEAWAQIPTILAIITMGCFILYDNRRKKDK